MKILIVKRNSEDVLKVFNDVEEIQASVIDGYFIINGNDNKDYIFAIANDEMLIIDS